MGNEKEKNRRDIKYYSDLIKKDENRVAIDNAKIEVDSDSIKEILDKNTFSGIPDGLIKGKDKLAKRVEQQKLGKNKAADQVAQMFVELSDDLNREYKLDIKFDLDSFSKSLGYIISPRNKQALDLFLSEAYSRFRTVLFLMYLNSISTLSAQILDPDFLLSESMSLSDKLITMKLLYEFMISLNEINEYINIPDAALKLQKLKEEQGSSINTNNPKVLDALAELSSLTREEQKDKGDK
jgi:hypothetical protein